MKKRIDKNWKTLLAFVLICFIAVILLFYFITIRQTMYEESSAHLDEVSRQVAASMEKQSKDQWNMVRMFSQYFKDLPGGNWESFEDYVQNQQDSWGFSSLCLVDDNAMYYDKGNRFSLLSQEKVTRVLLTQRQPVILDNVLFGDESKLIFLLPVDNLRIQGKTYPAIGASYNSNRVFDLLEIEAFDGEGTLYITHEDGTVLFRTQRQEGEIGYNLFNSLEKMTFRRGSVRQFREDVETGREELMTVTLDGTEYYLNHTTVGVDDWQLVMLVPVGVVSGRIQQVSVLSFVCLFAIGVLAVGVFILFYSDATQRVLRAKEEARRAAESANLAKSRFLSNMSHDIRTPMNAIIGMTAIAAERMDDPKRVRDCLKKIELSSRLLVGLINDILDMSKIESGKMALHEEEASLVELMENLVGVTQPSVQQKRQDFQIRLHGVIHETLLFDALRLNQILMNLLGNALKFTPEGGRVCLDVTEGPPQRAGYAHIIFRVSDTGIGMSPAFLQHLFTSFSRERDSRVDKIEGSGLGMAITKMLVGMMGGSISVESAPDKGSVFTVELDLGVAGAPEPLSLPALRILLAESDPDSGRTAGAYLETMGAVVDVTRGGADAALKTCQAHAQGADYAMVLLDWRLADLDCLAAAREIRNRLGTACPVLIATGYDWSQMEENETQQEVDGFLQKPLFPSTLYRCIHKYVLHSDKNAGQQAQMSADLSGRRILLAEDNEINQEIVVELLTGLGAVVETAHNGRQAVERFAASTVGEYDLVLMDIQMPEMNGYQATAAIRRMAREDASRIPIFAMTADAFAEDIEMAHKAGMNCHLAKPLHVPALLREITKYIG